MSRDTSYDSAIAVQEKVLDAIKVGREATLTAAEEVAAAYTSSLPKMPEWVDAFATTVPKLPQEWVESFTPKMPELPSFTEMLAFTQKIWEGQREFNMKMYDVIAPIGRSVFSAAKETAAKADKVAADNAKAAAANAKAAADHTKAATEHTTRSTTAKS